MKLKDFINKLKHIASLPTTYYSVAGGDWAKWNGSSWNFDCVILVKAILWGWCENKNHSHGGANYLSNGVADDTADGLINRCSNVSSDFSKLEEGELLYMSSHVGVYIGNGEVIECTGAWERKVLYSKIGANGERSRNGINKGKWLKHGKLPYIDYTKEIEEPKALQYKVGDIVHINGVYVSSASDTKLTPAITKGTITTILTGKRNPYLLNNGNIGWVNDSCIISCENMSNTYYIVKTGDTLSSIARKFNTSVQNIYNANKALIDGENQRRGVATSKMWVYPGQKLVIKV